MEKELLKSLTSINTKPMKEILSLLALLVSIQGIAQITISRDDMPRADDTLRYSISNVDATSEAIYTQTGENFSWDFTHLEPIQQRVANYERAWQTPYALFFLGFDKYGTQIIDTLGFGEFALTDVYDFYQVKESAFEAEGRGFRIAGGIPTAASFSDDDEIYQFPLTYGRVDSSTFAFEIGFQDIFNYQSQGYRINRVDGWGKISTPYGTFDCIRLVSDIVAFDTIQAQGFDLGFQQTRREYKWLANDEAYPILQINGLVNDGNFTPTTLRYRDDYRMVDLLSSTDEFLVGEYGVKIAPNPVLDGRVTVNYTLAKAANVQFDLYSIDGKLVQQLLQERQLGGKQQVYFQLVDLPKGLYFLRVQIDGQQQAFPLILEN